MNRTMIVIAGAAALAGSAQAQYTIGWWSVDGGGAMNASGGAFTLGGTAGQADAGTLGSPAGYQIVGGFSFYERQGGKDVLSYLSLLINPKDDLAFARVVNVPPRGLGKLTVAQALEVQLRIGEDEGGIGLRVAIASLCLLPLLMFQGHGPQLRRHWKSVFFVGVLNSGLPFACFAFESANGFEVIGFLWIASDEA